MPLFGLWAVGETCTELETQTSVVMCLSWRLATGAARRSFELSKVLASKARYDGSILRFISDEERAV